MRAPVPDLRRVRKVPVALVMFNRPDCTRRVFERIAEYRPEKLLLAADGPRTEDERALCDEVRAVEQLVDWDCEVLTNYSDTNLGMKRREISAFDWVFDQCEEAIVLEDDTLPARSFFPYCAELLERFRDDDRVMMIGGDNYIVDGTTPPYSYFFSKYPGTWGWAGWRRAWQVYDETMAEWPAVRETSWVEDTIGEAASPEQWRTWFDDTYAGRISTWDYQWTFGMWRRNGFCISPARNLIRNIGFGKRATNTQAHSRMARLGAAELDFPLRHPPIVEWSPELDRKLFAGERRLAAEPLPRRMLRRGLGLGLRRVKETRL